MRVFSARGRIPVLLGLLVMMGLSSPPPAQAQTGTGADRPLRWIQGLVLDANGNVLSGALVAASSPDRIDTTRTDASGRFLMSTTEDKATLGAEKVEGRSKYVCFGSESVPMIPLGDTLQVVLDARRGNLLRAERVRSDPPGLPDRPLFLSPGQRVEVTVDFRLWVRFQIPQMDIHLVAGVDDEPQARHIIGTPGTYPGMNGRAVFDLTAPSAPGIYPVYLLMVPESETSEDVLFSYYREQDRRPRREHIFIPLGEMIVE